MAEFSNSVDSWERRELILERFEAAWRRGERPDLDAFFPSEGAEHSLLLRELILTDLEWRLKADEPARVEDYLRRYPALQCEPDTLLALLAAEFELRRRRELTLSWKDFALRFPQFAVQLQHQLQFECTVLPETSTVPLPAHTERPATGAASRGRYRPLRLHARGGLGEVLVAHDEELNREVALKRIQQRHQDHTESRRRFLVEAEITGRLEHPGIVPVYGMIQDENGQPCYAMRFIRGQTLQEAIACFHAAATADRGLALRQLLGRFVDVCNTIAYAHSRRVIHRDLKPANIMLGDYGETLVVDWGLAKRLGASGEATIGGGDDWPPPSADQREGGTPAGDVLGTPAFMSPEQASGRPDLVGPASDIYSLGATLYALLTGRPPFSGESLVELLNKVRRGDFAPPRQVPPDTSRALEAICLKAMAREPAARYATALELAAEVERWLADEPVSAYRERWAARARRWARRHRTRVTAVAVLLLTAVVVGGIGAAVARRERATAAALGRIDALRNATPPAVPALLDGLDASEAHVVARLRQLWDQEDLPDADRRRVGLALLPAYPDAVRGRLLKLMLEAEDAQEVLLLREPLAPYAADQRAGLWARARQPTTDGAGQLRVFAALAAFDPESTCWPAVADRSVELLLTATGSLDRGTWARALAPVRQALLPALRRAVLDRRATEQGLVAATILAEYAADQPERLLEVLPEAGPEQYAALWPKLRPYPKETMAAAEKELHTEAAAGASDAALDAQASRQANAAVTLLKLGHAVGVWPLLRSGPEPRLRSYLIHRLAALNADPAELLRQLVVEQDASVRQALFLSLGEYAPDRLPAEARDELRANGQAVYRQDPDPGIHSAAEWLLRRLGADADVRAAERELVSSGPLRDRRWYHSKEGHAMVVIAGPVEFPMRVNLEPADPNEPEVLKTLHIPYSFAIASKEVTLEQYRRFLRANPDLAKEYQYNPRYAPEDGCPATAVTWLHAARYCRWLSAQEGIPERQWCFPMDVKDGDELPDDYVKRTGYRLPTQEEWECACRAGTRTSRAYGSAPELMKYYGWHLDNGGARTWPVGLLKPNDLGMFDMYGNVAEWCSDEKRWSQDIQERILRGSFLFLPAAEARTAFAAIHSNRPTFVANEVGMRVARTLPAPATAP